MPQVSLDSSVGAYGPQRASGVSSEALSHYLPGVDVENPGFFATVWEVCKIAFGIFLAIGVVVETINLIGKIITLCQEAEAPSKDSDAVMSEALTRVDQAQGVFLSSVNWLGGSAALLNWAHQCEWINLGPVLETVAFIGYPVTFITSAFSIVDHIREIKDLSQLEQTVEIETKKKEAIIHLVTKISMLVFSVLGALGVLLSMPVLSGVGFIFLAAAMLMQGGLLAFKTISGWQKQQEVQPAKT
jgi:uncharacterized membrane protein YphA (DoxX/SURF4 family)